MLLSRFAAVFYAILGQESPLCSLFPPVNFLYSCGLFVITLTQIHMITLYSIIKSH
ncbi:hypothetical protein HMPREF3197_00737 [Klebsiella pneumoniae]|nr:hypothetical protein HMPREF3197_00737 [Klebsiella pneumoniae]